MYLVFETSNLRGKDRKFDVVDVVSDETYDSFSKLVDALEVANDLNLKILIHKDIVTNEIHQLQPTQHENDCSSSAPSEQRKQPTDSRDLPTIDGEESGSLSIHNGEQRLSTASSSEQSGFGGNGSSDSASTSETLRSEVSRLISGGFSEPLRRSIAEQHRIARDNAAIARVAIDILKGIDGIDAQFDERRSIISSQKALDQQTIDVSATPVD